MPHYAQIQPVIQSGWYTCWAAAMSWWTHAASDRGRKLTTEEEFLKQYPRNWDKNGAMSIQGLTEIFNEQSLNMRSRFSDGKDLDRIIEKLRDDPVKQFDAFPIIIGYNDKAAGGNHIAVLCAFGDAASVPVKFVTMDPARGYITRNRDYFESQRMIYAWDKTAGDIIYG